MQTIALIVAHVVLGLLLILFGVVAVAVAAISAVPFIGVGALGAGIGARVLVEHKRATSP